LPPNITLEIDWIHGYCGDQNGLSYIEDDNVAYQAAAVGVCYKAEGHSQRFFDKHESRVSCIAYHPDKRTVATGQAAPKAVVLIWDAITMKQLVRVTSKNLVKGIAAVAFSPSGKLLAITDASDDANVIVVDTKTGAEVAKSRKAAGNIAFEDESTFVTVCAK
jgi:WD40 repeat protein